MSAPRSPSQQGTQSSNPSPATSPEPQDELERAVIEARAGKLPIRELVERLFSSRLCILLNKEIPASGVWPPDVVPLVLTKPTGAELTAVFSNLDRAAHMATQVATHKYCLQVEAQWLIGRMARRYGLVLNPGLPVTFEMSAEGLEAARREFGAASSP